MYAPVAVRATKTPCEAKYPPLLKRAELADNVKSSVKLIPDGPVTFCPPPPPSEFFEQPIQLNNRADAAPAPANDKNSFLLIDFPIEINLRGNKLIISF
jgi:hypothetical protein